jgi:hypothetical protein
VVKTDPTGNLLGNGNQWLFCCQAIINGVGTTIKYLVVVPTTRKVNNSMAMSKLRKSGFVRDKKTGRKRRVDVKRSRIAKRVARKRIHRRLKPATRTKISRGIRNTLRKRRTKTGRRVMRTVKHLTTKPYSGRKSPRRSLRRRKAHI